MGLDTEKRRVIEEHCPEFNVFLSGGDGLWHIEAQCWYEEDEEWSTLEAKGDNIDSALENLFYKI